MMELEELSFKSFASYSDQFIIGRKLFSDEEDSIRLHRYFLHNVQTAFDKLNLQYYPGSYENFSWEVHSISESDKFFHSQMSLCYFKTTNRYIADHQICDHWSFNYNASISKELIDEKHRSSHS